MDKLNNIDEFFRAAREQQAVHSFDDVAANFIASSIQLAENNPMKKKKSLSLKKWIMVFTAITFLVGTFIWFNSNTKSFEKVQLNKLQAKIVKHNKTPEDNKQAKQQTDLSKANNHSSALAFSPLIDVISFEELLIDETPLFNPLQDNSILSEQTMQPRNFYDEEPFPKLTEKEIEFAQKTKKQLLKSLYKTDKKEWAYIPTSSMPFQGKSVSVQSFYMLKAEVTNAQYLAFIYDLIIQNKKETFYKAKPDQKQWNTHFKSSMEPFVTHYFSHPAYADYPVVNVSQEGAELFCKWINEEYSKMYPKKENQINPVRLPFYSEWLMAASCGGKYTKYPWTGDSFRNTDGLIQANFVRTDLPAVADVESSNYDLTASAKSYWPNDFGIYNLSGNVAELVIDNTILPEKETDNTKVVRTVGGSFEKTAEYLEIYAADPYEGKVKACPAIGFRIVMTHLGVSER